MDLHRVLEPKARDRDVPAAADAIAFAGGLGIAVGVMLLTIDFYAHDHGRGPGVALFAAVIAAGYLGLWLLPREMHAGAITLIVASVPGALGWLILPGANEFGEIRPFLILVILAWAGCWLAPRTRGRSVFVAGALLLLWFWAIGEVAGTDAYSAAPIPSPPAHTALSLAALTSQVTISDLDSSSPLYSLAQDCAFGDRSSCDELHESATPGSAFEQFADTCGGFEPEGSGSRCEALSQERFGVDPSNGSGTFTPVPGFGAGPGSVLGTDADDKALEIGLVSLFFGIAYVSALALLDRRRWHGLGTAFVVPGVIALYTGTELLGEAANHAWVGGLLTFVAGVAVAVVGERGGRRFTTWTGGVFAAIGAYSFAGDLADYDDTFGTTTVSLVRPALITIAVGSLLVVLAWLIASARSRTPEPSAADTPRMPPLPDPTVS